MNCNGGYYSHNNYEYDNYYGDHDRDDRHDRNSNHNGDNDNHHRHDNNNDNDRHSHNNHNGDRYRNKEICGSDGVTYKNRCFFAKAQCKKNIVMHHEGPCRTIVTDLPQQTTPKVQIPDDFCKNLIGQPCHGVNPICGTNGQSYDNECEFEKAKCLDGNVHVKHLGIC